MAKDDVLARVDRDLTQGHTHPALQRLASLIEVHPDDLDLRARRAEVHRRVGNAVEAGRWGFLTSQVTDGELAAFERAWPSPWSRLRALRLRSDPSEAIDEPVRRRLAVLVQAAEREAPGPIAWTELGPLPGRSGSWRDSMGCLVAALVVLVTLVLVGIGVVAVISLAL